MEKVLISPKDLDEFHTAVQFFLKKQRYVPITTQLSNTAVPSCMLSVLKDIIPRFSNYMVTIHLEGNQFTSYGTKDSKEHLDRISRKEQGSHEAFSNVIGCIAFENHATAFKYIPDTNTVLYFDSHGVAPKLMITRLLDKMFKGCRIIHNTNKLQGRHGVCSLWAIWFCLLMSVTNVSIDEIQGCTLDDTYMMYFNSVLYKQTQTVTSISTPRPQRKLKFPREDAIGTTCRNLDQKHRLAQQLIIGMQTPRIYPYIHNINNAFNRIHNEITCVKRAACENKTKNEFAQVIETITHKILTEYTNIESACTIILNCECSYNSYERLPWEKYLGIVRDMRSTTLYALLGRK